MRISTKGRYGLAFMLDVLENQQTNPVSIKDISKRQGISDKYLEQIATILCKGGLLIGSRGAHGGYRLTREPNQYTVGEILRLTEGDLTPAPCTLEGEHACKRMDVCTNIILWKKIEDAISSVVDNITLEDMHQWKTQKTDEV